ncbi:MAG: hypothetical protein EXS48_00660 [Candidatus Staskawiczbacteria bacterium]|nr:hypothetical protein [Candidatus Staskawiczbacteria bacterium]
MNTGVEIIKNKEDILAIVIYSDYHKEGTNFFTPADFSQQLAFISRKKGAVIQAHTHKIIKRDVHLTQEVLCVRKGTLKVNLYDNDQKYFDSRELHAGDVVLLASGGHGFEFLDDVEMVEIKQGPYVNDDGKVGFEGIEKK